MFITFEGLDSSGKTTQANLLVDDCRRTGKEVVFLREPGGTEVSERIRDILLDREQITLSAKTELLLFSAARAQLVQQVILPELGAGRIVICDRFYDSTTAYQGYGRGLDLTEVLTLNRIATSGKQPDLTFFVDVELHEIHRRRQASGAVADRMESAGEQFYRRVLNGYQAIATSEPGRVVIVNGMRDKEEIHKDIWHIVAQKF